MILRALVVGDSGGVTAIETLVILDVDALVSDLRGQYRASDEIEGLTVHWTPHVTSLLRDLLELPGVVGAWVSDWCAWPSRLDALEARLGLERLLPVRASTPYLCASSGAEASPLAPELDSTHRDWWQAEAVSQLLREYAPRRWAWCAPRIHCAANVPGNPWKLGVFEDRFLLRTTRASGLTGFDLSRLKEWVRGG